MRRDCQCDHSARNVEYTDTNNLFEESPELERNVQNALDLLAVGAGQGGAGIYDAGMQDKVPEHKGEIFNIYTGEDANSAPGEYSHAEGQATIAAGRASHAQGFHNSPYDSQGTPYLFSVGNGNSVKRSNAFAVGREGNGYFAGKVRDKTGELLIPVVPINTLSPNFISLYGDIEGFEASAAHRNDVFYAYYEKESSEEDTIFLPTNALTILTERDALDPEINYVIDNSIVYLPDLNEDGVANASDAALILIAASRKGADGHSGLTPWEEVYADANRDGEINASDSAIVEIFAASAGAGDYTSDLAGWTQYLIDRGIIEGSEE